MCKINNTTPTAFTLKLGLSKGNAASWKRGGNPSVEILTKIADEFNCSTDYLLGRTDEPTVNR
jgi:transcriptional regulator with XRE-family HTH domain